MITTNVSTTMIYTGLFICTCVATYFGFKICFSSADNNLTKKNSSPNLKLKLKIELPEILVEDPNNFDQENQQVIEQTDTVVSRKSSSTLKRTSSQITLIAGPIKPVFSSVHARLNMIVPDDSISKMFASEITHNSHNKIMACCNPYCKKQLSCVEYVAYDGYYCSMSCLAKTKRYIDKYWNEIYTK